MANPVVDVVAGVTPGAAHAADRPGVPGLGQGRPDQLGDRRLGGGGAAPGREFADPLPAEWRDALDLWGRTEAFGAIHLPETLGRRRAGAAPAGLRRALPAPARAGAAAPGLRGERPGAAPRRLAARGHRRRRATRWSRAFLARPALRAHHGAAPGAGRHLRRHGRAPPHAPAPPGRRRVGQDGRGGGRAPGRGAGRAPGRADGADRGAGRAALHRRCVRCWATSRAPGGMAGGEVRVELLTSRIKGKARTPCSTGLAVGRRRPGRGHPRPPDRGRRRSARSGAS